MKQCPKCKEKYYDNVEMCTNDNEKLVSFLLKGVTGWLGFFVWINLILIPILIFIVLTYPVVVGLFPRKPFIIPSIPLPLRFVVLALLGYKFYACYLLLMQRKGAASLIKKVLIAWIIADLSALVLYFLPINWLKTGYFARSAISRILSGLIWLAYFNRSKRVKDTFPQD